jgi:hypothetical protein
MAETDRPMAETDRSLAMGKPAIDGETPARLETATFALG